jgi:hypothetical protein
MTPQEPEGAGPETGSSEPSPETGTTPEPETGERQSDGAYWKAQAEKYEKRAKANAEAAKDLDKLRRESMTEQERVAAEAADRAATEVTARLGGRLVRAEMRAAANGRLTAEQVEAVASRLDVSAFLTGDGDVDGAAVAEFVNSLAPPPPDNGNGGPVFPDLGQGARGGHLPLNGDPLERDLRNKLGLAGR